MDAKQATIDTYNQQAQALAQKFDALGARTREIDEVLDIFRKENPFVLEIGCGNGRDALEICKRTDQYLGTDISHALISLAREKVPAASFEEADVETYSLPPNIDIVFAFASLIHVDKESLAKILKRIFAALSSDGLVYLSMKSADVYCKKLQTDQFGTRIFYLYSLQDILDLASDFLVLKTESSEKGGQSWIEVLLQKHSSY